VAKHDTTSTTHAFDSQYSELSQEKQPQMIGNALMWTEFVQRIFNKTFQNNSWLVDGHEVWMRSCVQLKHPWQAAMKL